MREASDGGGHAKSPLGIGWRFDQITSMQRAAEAARGDLSKRHELPVSRGYLPAVRPLGSAERTKKNRQEG